MTEGEAPLHVADAYALKWIADSVDEDDLGELWERLTEFVEQGQLAFPRAVVTDLTTIARGEPVQSWAAGLGSRLNAYTGNIKYTRPLMAHVADLGFENGFDALDGKDPSVAAVGRFACQCSDDGLPFVIVTEDVGLNPLRPTMEQLADAVGWSRVSAYAATVALGFDDLIY